jgi:uncharacterized protein YrzB (UPF0473 family)
MEDDRIIELEDDEGGKERFIYLTNVDHEDRQFAILTPEEPENEEEEAIVILELLPTEDSDEMELVSVEDDELADAIFQKYTEMVESEDDEDDESDEDESEEDE